MKLLQTKDYLLLIDEEAEIKMDDYCVNFDRRISHLPLKIEKRNIGGYGSEKYYFSHKKVIAYYPLTKEAKELDLPLLPNPFEDVDIEKLAFKNLFSHWNSGDVLEHIELAMIKSFVIGYKAAKSKQFSLEDVKKAFQAGSDYGSSPFSGQGKELINEEKYIQSLSTQQLPKEFIHEHAYDPTSCLCDKKPCKCRMKVFKTIINSKGKEEIQGTYKY